MNSFKKRKDSTEDLPETSTGPSPSAKNSGKADDSGFWKEEIDSLDAGEYHSLDEVMDALIDRVELRIGRPSRDSGAFLRQLLELDPELRERLVKAFGVRDNREK